MNIILGIINIILVYSAVLIIDKYLKKEGLIVWITFATITANIIVCKSIDIFSVTLSLGNILFASNFLATNIISEKYNINYHIKSFDKLCNYLNGYVKNIIVSFLDDYKNVRNNKDILKYRNLTSEDYKTIGINFSRSASKNNMAVQTCCEENNLVEYGFIKRDCISSELVFKLTGKIIKKWKERKCGCVQMVDIGVYNSCRHFCKYCYANYDENKVLNNYEKHNKNSSLLVGELQIDDVIKRRLK